MGIKDRKRRSEERRSEEESIKKTEEAIRNEDNDAFRKPVEEALNKEEPHKAERMGDTGEENGNRPDTEAVRQGEGTRKPSPGLFLSAGNFLEENYSDIMKCYFSLVILLCILIIGPVLSGKVRINDNPNQQNGLNTESAGSFRAETEKISETEKPEDKKETKMTEIQSGEILPVQEENWEERIFGREDVNIAERQIFVTGLSSSEKEKLSFRESSFTKAVTSFFASERIDARTIEFTKRLAVSTDEAQEYLARIPGHEDLYLAVLMYPEFPGRYILSLLDLRGLSENSPETERRSETVSPAGSDTMAQSQQMPSSTVLGTDTYDATNLSVMSVPSTLVNYLDNRYELQYTLYDFLYRNGRQSVQSASVANYSIDPDERTATIILNLDDGSTLTGVYKKDSNRYSYRF